MTNMIDIKDKIVEDKKRKNDELSTKNKRLNCLNLDFLKKT